MSPWQRAVSYSAPTRRDHLRFCEIEGWNVVRSGTRRRSSYHETPRTRTPGRTHPANPDISAFGYAVAQLDLAHG